MRKYEIINKLKEIAKKLNKSPGRREIPFKLYRKCVKNFGSFNKVKSKAGLSIIKRKCDPLPKKSYKFTKDLVKIMSYLMFDGHLYKDLKGFYFSSKEVKSLKDFERSIIKQFGIKPYYKYNTAGYRKQTHKVFMFNVKASKFLNEIGVPKGDKMVTTFDIPNWIKENKEFSKEYLKIAFYCEGCKYKASKNSERIQFNLNKSEELLEDGLNFMKSLKYLLKNFDIETTSISLTKGNLRKRDGKTTKTMKFNIRANSINKFINQIGWYK
ncbi:hypothetical protein K8R47_02685 [archaeon]|nr:hypothetical protein [archaeon]